MGTISTIKLSKRFIKAGTSKKEAEVLAEVFKETEENSTTNMATKKDLKSFGADMKVDFASFKAETKADFASFKAETKEDFASFKAETKEDFASFKAETKEYFELFRTEIKDYMKLCTILISLGITALGFLMTYLHAH